MLRRLCCLLLLASLVGPVRAADKPAVLFYGGVHAKYVAQPLHEMGLEVDSCPAGQLAARLATGKYNVAVVSTLNAADRAAVEQFLAKGGGVFFSNPENFWSSDQWTPTNQWLAERGARSRWELLQDTDPNNVVRDVMGSPLSFSDRVTAPCNEGVRGVLTLVWGSTTGLEPPMSLDFSPEWTVVVRGAQSMQGKAEVRNDPPLQPWIPQELAAPGPPLMAVREQGGGRLAVMGIRAHWLFYPPTNCPTTEAMLTAGAGGKPSDWLKVFANAFRWLAQPSQQKGLGGAVTPPEVLNPPVKQWEIPAPNDWSKVGPAEDLPQVAGLIGARTKLSTGSGTVAEYATAARAAGLQFIVFLEDSLKMKQEQWDQLVAECQANSDDKFLAVPGLTYEDAQQNHHYAFADNVKFPKPSMLLPDGRLATTQSMRSRAFFDYDNELLMQEAIRGYWRHDSNQLHWSDYKLYNSFPIYSFYNGQPIDDALPEYLYWQGLGGCQNLVALEFMDRPAQVARRAREGWRVICHRSLTDLKGKWHYGAWSFSGSGSQYITNGPRILAWDSPNRLIGSNGQWWRPDLWEYRVRFKVASDVGLKSVLLYDGDREVFRRWLPTGAKQFATELVLANCQQRGWNLVVEDLKGGRAISMSFWNRNLNQEEFMCSDRCNFLGSARLRTRAGEQYWTPIGFSANMGVTPSKGRLDLAASPAVSLTPNSPTLPVDGAPAGFPTYRLNFGPSVPGELSPLYAKPHTWLISPEIAIGQADIEFGYDPAEKGALKTALGFPYEQPQEGSGNAWGGWHRLIPTRKVQGWQRTYACNWLTRDFRLGWHETQLTVKEAFTLPDKGLDVTYFRGELWQGEKKIGGYDSPPMSGPWARGTFATLEDKGGAVVLIGSGDYLVYDYNRGNLVLYWKPPGKEWKPGSVIHYVVPFAGAAAETRTEQMLAFARKFGVAAPGTVGYTAEVKQGALASNYLALHLDALHQAAQVHIPKADLPGFLPVVIENLNDNWSVVMHDAARPAPNVRSLPLRGGRSYAQIDTSADSDLFLGHPVLADNPQAKLLVSWQDPGKWFVEAHNPTDKPMALTLSTAPGWTVFAFAQKLTLKPGTSQIWTVQEKK